MRIVLLVSLVFVVLACGAQSSLADGGSGTAGGRAGAAGGAGGGAGGGGPAPCTCGRGRGCVELVVTRAPDAGMQPWVVWPAEADGVGNLIGSLLVPSTSPTVVAARAVVSGADFKPVDARYVIDLGCLDAGTYQGQAFLDDDLNTLPTQTGSASYRDSCARGGAPPPAVVQASTRVSIPSCSPPPATDGASEAGGLDLSAPVG
ncbi:MAG: hypothetical protein JNJ54_20510 [Myxococcaceae bacterium]|nr:hypothetical protein [Myxococcaceae bacterium]